MNLKANAFGLYSDDDVAVEFGLTARSVRILARRHDTGITQIGRNFFFTQKQIDDLIAASAVKNDDANFFKNIQPPR